MQLSCQENRIDFCLHPAQRPASPDAAHPAALQLSSGQLPRSLCLLRARSGWQLLSRTWVSDKCLRISEPYSASRSLWFRYPPRIYRNPCVRAGIHPRGQMAARIPLAWAIAPWLQAGARTSRPLHHAPSAPRIRDIRHSVQGVLCDTCGIARTSTAHSVGYLSCASLLVHVSASVWIWLMHRFLPVHRFALRSRHRPPPPPHGSTHPAFYGIRPSCHFPCSRHPLARLTRINWTCAVLDRWRPAACHSARIRLAPSACRDSQHLGTGRGQSLSRVVQSRFAARPAPATRLRVCFPMQQSRPRVKSRHESGNDFC